MAEATGGEGGGEEGKREGGEKGRGVGDDAGGWCVLARVLDVWESRLITVSCAAQWGYCTHHYGFLVFVNAGAVANCNPCPQLHRDTNTVT